MLTHVELTPGGGGGGAQLIPRKYCLSNKRKEKPRRSQSCSEILLVGEHLRGVYQIEMFKYWEKVTLLFVTRRFEM